jgi:glycine/D-amino acid oxidase-like deaminating enzyme
MAREAVQAVVADFVARGGIYRHAAIRTPAGKSGLHAVQTAEGVPIPADAFVFACGPWLAKVFPELLGHRIFPTRQEVIFFGIPPGDDRFSPPRMPVWIDFSDGRGMYGFPDLETRGFKVAFDLHGPAFDPDSGNRIVRPEKVEAARTYVSERFPALTHAPVVDSRVCQYENTSNGDFIIDRHPEFENVWIAGGGSGHGFKHGPAVGEYAAARVTGSATPPVEARFSLASKGAQQHRSVY